MCRWWDWLKTRVCCHKEWYSDLKPKITPAFSATYSKRHEHIEGSSFSGSKRLSHGHTQEFVNIRRYSTVVFTRPPVADQVRRREVGLPEETSGKLTNKLLWNCGHSIFRLKRHCITGLRVSYCSSTEYLGTPHNSDLWDFPLKSLNEGYMSSMLRT